MEEWSNRTSRHKAYKPPVALQQEVEAAKGSNKLLDHHEYQDLFESVSCYVRTAPIRNVAKTFCTCLRRGLNDKKILSLMAEEVEKRDVKNLSAKDLGYIVRSLAVRRMHTTLASLMDKCVLEVKNRLCVNSFNDSRSLAMVCWALTVTNKWSADFAEVVHTYIMNHTTQIPSTVLTTLLWSLGRLKHADRELVKTVLRKIVVDELNPTDHCQVLQTLKDALFCDKQYFDALAEYVVAGKNNCLKNPWFINIVATTCCVVHYYHSEMMDCLADAALKQLSKLSVSGLGSTGHAFSHANHIRRDLLLAIIKQLCNRDVGFQSWISLVWACLVAEVYPPELFQIRTWEKGWYCMI